LTETFLVHAWANRNQPGEPSAFVSTGKAFPPAILALADGTVFIGNSIGAAGSTTGEVVFNTAMTGYQEILTDPSYCQQIVTLTYPHIGNYGVNAEDVEAEQGPRRRPDHPRPAADRLQLPRRP
jgi:carbamoyl-phosphate synthase small subunit